VVGVTRHHGGLYGARIILPAAGAKSAASMLRGMAA